MPIGVFESSESALSYARAKELADKARARADLDGLEKAALMLRKMGCPVDIAARVLSIRRKA